MMQILINWVISALVIFITAYVLKGVHVDTLWTAFVVAVVLGFLNTFIKPLLVILTLPITVVTLGLFLLIINALMVLLASNFVPGFDVDGFWWAVLFSIVVSGIKLLMTKIK